jgi:hypothetical protein
MAYVIPFSSFTTSGLSAISFKRVTVIFPLLLPPSETVSLGRAAVAGFVAGFCWALVKEPVMSNSIRNNAFFIIG